MLSLNNLNILNTCWQIFVDGASRKNPGPAGAGIYIKNKNEIVLKDGYYLGIRTNNQAEYLALALALFFVNKHSTPPKNLIVTSDSELMIKQMKGEYKVKNEGLKPIKKMIDLLRKNMSCIFRHVLREKNKIADKQANLGIDNKKKMPKDFICLLKKYGI